MRDAVEVIDQQGSLRLIKADDPADGAARYAIVEARDGAVYSLHGHDRRQGPDTAAGMADVVAPDGWQSELDARRTFVDLVRDGNRLSKEIW